MTSEADSLFFSPVEVLSYNPFYSHQPPNYLMDVSGDGIADAVLQEFERWPKKRKPRGDRGENVKEWVPLSGIVAEGSSLVSSISTDRS